MNISRRNSPSQRFPAAVALLIGILMAGQWLFFLGTGRVPELETEPAAISFHLAAELLTALALVLGGFGLLRRHLLALPATLIAFGMVGYSVINSAGYFAQQQQWPAVVMFGLLLILVLAAIQQILRSVR